MSSDLGNVNIDDYMSGAGYGNASNLPIEPGSMAEAGMFNDVADPESAQLQGLLDYQKGQYGVTVPTTEAELGLPPARTGRGGGAFAQNNARNAVADALRPAPKGDEHPITIAMPTPSGVNAQRHKLQTPKNTYRGTVLDGIGASVPSRSERLSMQEEFKAQAKKDQEIRDAYRQKQIEENADGHYTKEKLVQVNRKYREEVEATGDRYDSYVDTMGAGEADATRLNVEARLKAKRERQEEYKLLLQEQQELKKLHDARSLQAQPPSHPSGTTGSPVRGALASIGMSSPSATEKAGRMTKEQKARYREQQLQYRQELDKQLENRKYNQQLQEQHPPPRRRPSKDVDVQQVRESEAAQARNAALSEIPQAEISEFERRRLQQQKLLVQSLESTSSNLDLALAGGGGSAHKTRGRAPEEAAKEGGDYFSGVGQYQSEIQSKDRKTASALAYQEQLRDDLSKQEIRLPRRSLRDMKRDPFALDEQEAARIRAGQQEGLGVFTSPHKHQSAALPQVGKGSFGSVASGAINMAPGDMAIIQENKQAAQARYAAQLAEDSQTPGYSSPRRSLAAERRAQRMKENQVPYWPADLVGPGASLSNGTLSGAETQGDKRERQERLRQELLSDERRRAAAREAELSVTKTPRSPRISGRTYGVAEQAPRDQPRLSEYEPAPPLATQEPGGVNAVRASQELFSQFHQSLDEPSLSAQEEEDREAIAAYEEYLRQAAVAEAEKRIRINRKSNREALADALYDNPTGDR
jgi:hypothetical protein